MTDVISQGRLDTKGGNNQYVIKCGEATVQELYTFRKGLARIQKQQQQKMAEELIQQLKMCNRQRLSVKRTFGQLGMSTLTESRRPFVEMEVETVLGYLINWIIQRMPMGSSVELPIPVNEKAYEVTFGYKQRRLLVTNITEIKPREGGHFYQWAATDCYDNTTCWSIEESQTRADFAEITRSRGEHTLLSESDYEMVKELIENA